MSAPLVSRTGFRISYSSVTMAAIAERRRLSGDHRRVLIQREAGRLFARSGYAATTLDDIAAAGGVTKPMVYRHFASKKALYLELLAKHEQDLPTFFEGIDSAELDGSPEGLVRAILDVWFDYVRENRHAWVMLFRDSSGDEEIRRVRCRVSLSARRVMAGFIAGQRAVPPDEVEP